MSSDSDAELRFSHNVIEHLGIKLYKNKTGNVLAELLANCWDADAKNVEITLDQNGGLLGNGCIIISDDGCGMSYAKIKDHYLHVGKPKRRRPSETSAGGRKPMGRKGLGKLAPFGIARVVDVATISDGVLNWFTLDLDEILKAGEQGAYPPKFHVREAELSSGIAWEDDYISKRVAGFVELCLDDAEKTGTLVILSSIDANHLPSKSEVASELGSRFTVVLLRDDFVVSIDGDRLSEAEALPKFEFRIPEGSGQITENVGGKEVKFWVGFVEKAEWSSDQAGVGVFAHNKIAQSRPFFFGSKGKEVFQRYLYAVVEADWIDEVENDLISTDRTSVDWSHAELSEFYAWGQAKVGSWISQYEKHRKSKQDQEVRNQAAVLRSSGSVNTYSPSENEQIVGLVSDATRAIGKTKSAEQTREELLIAVSKAWINQPTRQFLGDLWASLLEADASPDQIGRVVEQLSSHSVPEKMGLALTFSQRAFALTVLHDLVHQRSETDLQKLVTEFPWILQPRGDLLTADRHLKTTIDAAAAAADDAGRYDPAQLIQGMSAEQRADFVFLTSPNDQTIKVVEIKKPDLPLGVEQERQLVAYLDFIQAQRAEAQLSGILVGNTTNFKANDRRIRAMTWSEVFLECRAAYVDLLASMLEIADIEGGDTRLRIIKEIGGDRTWELLRKLSETDEALSDLFRQFDAHLPKAAS